MTIREYEFTVVGSGKFPIDMLRYDNCYPKSETDSAAIEGREMRRVRLVARTFNSDTPCVARWAFFNWKVVADGGRTPA